MKALGEERDVGRRIAVLGPMRELGEHRRRAARRAGPGGARGQGRPADPGRRGDAAAGEALGGAIAVDRADDADEAAELLARAGAAGRRGAGQGVQLDRACEAGRANGRGRIGLMLYLDRRAAWLSRHPQPHPLHQLPRRRGDRDRADDRAVDRAGVHPLASRQAGQGPADPRRRPAEPPRQARHADDGRAADPDLGRRSRSCCGWTSTNPYVWACLLVTGGFGLIGFLDDYDKVKKAHHAGLSGKMRLLLEFAIAGFATWLMVRSRRHAALSAVRPGRGDRPRLVLHRVRGVRDRGVRQCGEPDRRARRAGDDAGDHRRDGLHADRLPRRQCALRRLSRHSARARARAI